MQRDPSQLGTLPSLYEEAIKRFESAWLTGSRPDISEFLASNPDSDSQLLCELVHIDLELRFRHNETPTVEEYLLRFPQLKEHTSQVLELISSEYFLANRYGHTVARQSVLARFPEYHQQLESLLAPGDSTPTWTRRSAPRSPIVLPRIPGYLIEEELGRGGMGVVYRATQPALQRTVAIKTLLYGLATTPELKSRFRHEAEAIARLDHPHLVPIYEVGEWTPEGAADSIPYFVMKFYPGGSLANEPNVADTDPLFHAATMETIASAVHHAHQRGILHRDLKPSNILLDEKGLPHVVDFGLAGRFDPNDPQSMTATIMGTPAYMAPEQARSPAQVTTSADVYGLGAILYHLLTGQPPFRLDAPLVVLEQVVHQEPARPSLLNPNIPRDLETICLKCLRKDPAERYDSPAALALDLRRFRAGQSILARPLPAWERAWRTLRRYPVISSLTMFSFLTLAALVVVLALSYFRISVQQEETRDALRREQVTYNELLSTFQREQQLLYGKRISSVSRLWATNQLPQAWAELDQCPERYRGWEWRYFDSLRSNEPPTLATTDTIIRAATYLNDTQIVTGDSEGTVAIWDWETATSRATWKAVPTAVRQLAVLPRKKWLAVCDQDEVTVWNYETRQQLARLPGSTWVFFSPDGELLAATHCLPNSKTSNDIIVWQTSDWKQKWLLRGHTAFVLNGAISPDSQALATCSSDRTVRRWNLATGSPLGDPWKRPLPVFRVAWLADGRTLAEARPSSVHWCDAQTGIERGNYHWSAVTQPTVVTGRVQVAAGPNPAIIAFSGPSHDVQLWNIETNRSLGVFRGHALHISSLEASPDGTKLISTSHDQTVRVWRNERPQEYRSFGAFTWLIHDVVLSPDSNYLAAVPNLHAQQAGQDKLTVLKISDGSEVGQFPGVGAALLTSDGALVSAQVEGGVACWDLSTKTIRWRYEAPKQRCLSLSVDAQGKTISLVLQAGKLVQLDAHTGKLTNELPFDEQYIGAAGFSRVAQRLVFVGKREVELWDLETRFKTGGFPMNGTRLFAFSNNKSLVAVAEADRIVRLRNAKTGDLLLTFPGHPRSVNALAFNADATRLVTSCADGLIRLWDVETGLELTVLPGQFEESVLVTWDHRHDQIIAVDTRVHLWQVKKK